MVEDLEQTKVSSSGFALIFIVSFRWKISLPGYSNDLHLGMDNRSVISWNQVCYILFRQNLKNIFLYGFWLAYVQMAFTYFVNRVQQPLYSTFTLK